MKLLKKRLISYIALTIVIFLTLGGAVNAQPMVRDKGDGIYLPTGVPDPGENTTEERTTEEGTTEEKTTEDRTTEERTTEERTTEEITTEERTTEEKITEERTTEEKTTEEITTEERTTEKSTTEKKKTEKKSTEEKHPSKKTMILIAIGLFVLLIILIITIIVIATGRKRKRGDKASGNKKMKNDGMNAGELDDSEDVTRKVGYTISAATSPGVPIIIDVYKNGSIINSIKANVDSSLILGRDSICDVVINNENLSGQHLVIEYSDDSFYVQDLDTTNGTYFNGIKMTHKRRLEKNDRLKIGEMELVIRW